MAGGTQAASESRPRTPRPLGTAPSRGTAAQLTRSASASVTHHWQRVISVTGTVAAQSSGLSGLSASRKTRNFKLTVNSDHLGIVITSWHSYHCQWHARIIGCQPDDAPWGHRHRATAAGTGRGPRRRPRRGSQWPGQGRGLGLSLCQIWTLSH